MTLRSRVRTLVVGSSAVLVIGAGCAATRAGAERDDVRALVEGRTKLYAPDQADPQVDTEIRKLLGRGNLTPDGAVQVAFLRNPRLQTLYEEVGIAKADLVQAGLLRNPVFDGAVRFGVPGRAELDLGVAQDILSIFQLPLRRRVAEAKLEATKLRVVSDVLDVAAEVREAFVRLQAETQLLEMREQVRTATAASYEAARKLREAGNVRDLDVDSERGLFDGAQLAVAASQSAVASARERLNVAMGLWGADASWTIAGRLPDVPRAAPDVHDAERRAVAASLSLARLRAEVDAAAREAETAGASRGIQDAEVGASAEREEGEWGVGPSLKLPLPLFDQGQARVARALAALRKREMELRSEATLVRGAARAAAQRLVTARAMAAFHRDEVLPLRARVVESTQLQYNAMQVGVFQLLAARQDQIQAGKEFVAAARDYWLARVEFEHVQSGGRAREPFAAAETEPRSELPERDATDRAGRGDGE